MHHRTGKADVQEPVLPLNVWDRVLWAAGFCGHLLLLGVLLRKGRVRHLPWFTTWISAEVLRSLLLYLVQQRGSGHLYLIVYLVTDGLDQGLQLAVVLEIAWRIFRPVGRWARDAQRSLPVLAVGSLALAAGLTSLAAPAWPDWRLNLFGKINFFLACVFSELFLGLLLLSVSSGLPWKTHLARVAQGLGVYSLVDILVAAGQTMVGPGDSEHAAVSLTHVRMLVYLGCVIYWIVTLWREAPAPRRMPADLQKHLQSLHARLAYDLFTLRSWK